MKKKKKKVVKRKREVIPIKELLDVITERHVKKREPQILIIGPTGEHKVFATFTDAFNYIVSIQKQDYVAVSGHNLQRIHFQF